MIARRRLPICVAGSWSASIRLERTEIVRHSARVVRLGWTSYLGQTDTLVSKRILGRYPVKVQDILVDALTAMEMVLVATDYENPCDYIGSYNKRPITGHPDVWSLHSYGIAVDLDYGGDTDGDGDPTIDKNPHIHRPIVPGDLGFGVEWQILEHQVEAIEDIKNLDGTPIWRWLGWSIGDTMHFDVNVEPQFTQVDWDSLEQPGDDEMNYRMFRADEFNLWTDTNIMQAYDAQMFESTNRTAFYQYWVVERDDRTDAEKARFMTDYYAHLWRR